MSAKLSENEPFDPAEEWSPQQGDHLYDEYKANKPLGKGGMNFLWQVASIMFDTQLFAMKFFKDQEPWEKEVSALRTIQGDNVVVMHDCFSMEEDPVSRRCAAVFEIGKFSLDVYLRHDRPVDILRVKGVLFDVVEGLSSCHEKGIVHCDLKPQNVMFFHTPGTFDRWKLIDFDSATKVGEVVPRATFEFCAPEVLRDADPKAAFAMDMFSLGRTLQWMTSKVDCFWGVEGEGNGGNRELLLSEAELPIEDEWIPHRPSRTKIKQLLRKDPESRLTLQALRDSSYMTGNLDTVMVRSLSDMNLDEDDEGETSSICPYKTVALYTNLEADLVEEGELPFVKGDELEILSEEGSWWAARLEDGQEGIVPHTYVLRGDHAQAKYKSRAIMSTKGVQFENAVLEFETPEEIEILEDSSDWLQGRNAKGEIGLIPPNYVLRESSATLQFKARALYAYSAETVTELSFRQGEVLDILVASSDQWQARHPNGGLGIVPSSYFQQASVFMAEFGEGETPTASVLDLVTLSKSPVQMDVRTVVGSKDEPGKLDMLQYSPGERLMILSTKGEAWTAKKMDGSIGYLTNNSDVQPLPKAKVLVKHGAGEDDHIKVRHGEVVTILQSVGEEVVIRGSTGRVGLVPSEKLMIIDKGEEAE